MPRDRFTQRKSAVLSKLDKSSIGKWDRRIKPLCEKINNMQDFYTTSSCSGRVILMIQQEKKENNLFLKVWHDKISFNQLKKELNNLIKNKVVSDKKYSNVGSTINKLNNYNKDLVNGAIRMSSYNLIKFKLEPPIIHIACRDTKKATEILEKAKYIGFKRSGILTCDRNIIVELNTSERMEFPIINKRKVLVDDEFLKLIVKLSNEKMEKWWRKIEKLEKKL